MYLSAVSLERSLGRKGRDPEEIRSPVRLRLVPPTLLRTDNRLTIPARSVGLVAVSPPSPPPTPPPFLFVPPPPYSIPLRSHLSPPSYGFGPIEQLGPGSCFASLKPQLSQCPFASTRSHGLRRRRASAAQGYHLDPRLAHQTPRAARHGLPSFHGGDPHDPHWTPRGWCASPSLLLPPPPPPLVPAQITNHSRRGSQARERRPPRSRSASLAATW